MNTISQHMTDEEIIRSYKNAESPKQMVGIICDRALCDKKTLVNFLYEHELLDNCQISAYVRHGMLPESAKAQKKIESQKKKSPEVKITPASVVNQPSEPTAAAPSAKVPEKEKPENIPPAVLSLIANYLDKKREQYESAKQIVNDYEQLEAYFKEHYKVGVLE